MKGYTHIDAEPFPSHTLRRVERPTTAIREEEVQRVRERDAGFIKAAMGDYGPVLEREFTRFIRKHPLGGALSYIRTVMIPLQTGAVAGNKAPLPSDPDRLTRHIKEVAYFLRADQVGICRLPPYAVYSKTIEMFNLQEGEKEVDLPHKYAIAILVDQDWRTSEATTGHDWISGSMSMMSYANSGFIANILADYIRRLGYPAEAHHAPNYRVVVPPILLWAGLGEMSRIGDCVVNPFLGPRFKAAVVTTDLPLVPDKPIDFGLQDFCSKCKKCARECPSGALSDGGKEIHNGYEKWPTDVKKCTSMRVGNQQGSCCGTCIRVCPWNKPYTPLHRAVGWAMRHSALARSCAIWGDDLLGYGTPNDRKKWWLDLEEVDGTLRIPRTKKE